jgi:hypothetical protein
MQQRTKEQRKRYRKTYYNKHKKQILNHQKVKEHSETGKAWRLKYYNEHKEQIKAYKKAYTKTHPRIYKYYNRQNYYLKRNHGITIEQYNQMFVNQGGLCTICKEHPAENTRLSVDHDHKTGKIRGLLCIRCNAGLGHFKDEINLLLNAIKYLSNM